jgi:hypothetical protein
VASINPKTGKTLNIMKQYYVKNVAHTIGASVPSRDGNGAYTGDQTASATLEIVHCFLRLNLGLNA